MAKKQPAKLGDTLDTIRPYLQRALKDEEFRSDLRDALQAARELYGPLSKGNGVSGSARVLATDKKAQESLRKTLEEISRAAGTAAGKPKKKSRKGRKMLLLAGVVAGALYNPWTGPQTREKLLDMIAGNDDLEPLEGFEGIDLSETAEPVGVAVGDADGSDAEK